MWLSGQAVLLGDTRPSRDFLYVKDTARGLLEIAGNAENLLGKVINLGTGADITIEDLARKIIEITQSSAKVVFDASRLRPKKSEVDRLCADTTLAEEQLKWSPSTTLEDGLKETVEWYRSYLSFYKPPSGYL